MRNKKTLVLTLCLLGLAVFLASCAPNATQDTLKPASEQSRDVKNLFMPIAAVAIAVFVLVEGAIVFILIKYRHRKGREVMPPQVHGNTKLELGWTIAPALILAFVMVPTVALIWKLAAPPPKGALNIAVEGHQWWWGFRYTDSDMKTTYGSNGPVTVADVMVIPVDRPVYLSLESVGGLISGDTAEKADYQVIHSFWIPQLAPGKQDVVPMRTNHILMSADEPGTYYGQCAEFCGLQHGRMRFRVEALSQEDWDAWVASQKGPLSQPTSDLAKRGYEIFMNPLSGQRGACINCHAIGGTSASSPAGPNLTHFADATHSCFAGCIWDTSDEEALRAWLENPNAVKLGSKMPNYNLSQDEIDALIAFLKELK